MQLGQFIGGVDAFNGCDKLIRVLNGEADAALLDLYDRQRRTSLSDAKAIG